VSNEALDTLVELADATRSRKMVAECVRAAYALGKFDAVAEMTVPDWAIAALDSLPPRRCADDPLAD
jgi:hypothetical protein